MKTSLLESISVQTPAVQLAHLSGPHGYRFEGDTVHLNAMFALRDPAAHERAWALQLWACPAAPASARDLAGHIVAEVSLPPMSELADEIEHFDVSAPAWPPAGAGEHVMVLVLASGRPGRFDEVHDLAVYPRRQEFVQPRMTGNVGYRVDGGRVKIFADRVKNPRAAENRSGTLSLELWALSAPFNGGRFEGRHLAGVEIGSVQGGSELALQPMELAFTAPPAGPWQIVLMLREWTASGFVTRDFSNFPVPYISAPVAEKAPAPVAEKPAAPIDAPKPVTAIVVRTPAPEAAKAAAPVSPAKAPADISAKCVSVNHAHVDELAAVKGLSKKLAEGIVKKRPFASLDELRRVKGPGVNILAKVRSKLKL
jgi:DNA uptake protein ComE-like DNA-binding protein